MQYTTCHLCINIYNMWQIIMRVDLIKTISNSKAHNIKYSIFNIVQSVHASNHHSSFPCNFCYSISFTYPVVVFCFLSFLFSRMYVFVLLWNCWFFLICWHTCALFSLLIVTFLSSVLFLFFPYLFSPHPLRVHQNVISLLLPQDHNRTMAEYHLGLEHSQQSSFEDIEDELYSLTVGLIKCSVSKPTSNKLKCCTVHNPNNTDPLWSYDGPV